MEKDKLEKLKGDDLKEKIIINRPRLNSDSYINHNSLLGSKEKKKKNKDKFKDFFPCVGVGILIVDQKREKVLLGRRIDSGLYGLPGGWIEHGEDWEYTASRELKEETNISKPPSSFTHIYTLNYYNYDKSFHSISCVMYSTVDELEINQLDNKEPNKCYGWFWISVAEMRTMTSQLFPPLREFIKKYTAVLTASQFLTYFKAKLDIESLFETESSLVGC